MRIGRFAIGLGATLLAAVMIAVLAARAPGTSTEALPAPGFVEEAAAAGIEHRYDGEFDFFVGGGVAVFDCNDDGRQVCDGVSTDDQLEAISGARKRRAECARDAARRARANQHPDVMAAPAQELAKFRPDSAGSLRKATLDAE